MAFQDSEIFEEFAESTGSSSLSSSRYRTMAAAEEFDAAGISVYKQLRYSNSGRRLRYEYDAKYRAECIARATVYQKKKRRAKRKAKQIKTWQQENAARLRTYKQAWHNANKTRQNEKARADYHANKATRKPAKPVPNKKSLAPILRGANTHKMKNRVVIW